MILPNKVMYDPTLQLFLAIFLIAIFIAIQIAVIRWLFRVNHIVMLLEQMTVHLEDIKKQNSVLIKQQDEMLVLLDTDAAQ